MKKHYHSNKYDKQRKYYENPKPVHNHVNATTNATNTANTPITVNTEYVPVTNVQEYPAASNGIKENIEISSTNSNGSTNTTSGFMSQEKFLINNAIAEKVGDANKSIPYYPLPSNEGYEKFLQTMKKDQYKKTQFSIPFLLSLRKKYEERPPNMKEIKVPLKNEIRSRAKILTDEAFRETRNYLDVHTEVKNPQSRDFLNNFYKKIAIRTKEKKDNVDQNIDEVYLKTTEIREMLNKISLDNFDTYCDQILKFNYNDVLLENFKNLVYAKAVTEFKYSELYVSLCYKMFKLYNKKTYQGNPRMNFKSLLLKKCQEEFYTPDETSIAFPFHMDEEERIARLREIKLGNIRLIGDFYLHNTIPIKIISECIDFLLAKLDDLNIRTLCELVKKICKKLYFEDQALLEKSMLALDNLYYGKIKDKPINVSTKVKFLILDVLDLQKRVWGIKPEDQLKKKDEFVTEIRSRKNSEIQSGRSRKSSINPTNVEYIRRSRFNSRADDLKSVKEANPSLIDELVSNLGADLEFYQCFRLTDEEFTLIKSASHKFMTEYNEPEHSLEEIKKIFNKMMEDVQCEKFIAVGHLIENMFSLNVKQSNTIMHLFSYLYENKIVDEEDIKHGLVLGLVNFKDNAIDYPNSKDYLDKFLKILTESNVIDPNLKQVYNKCIDNLGKY